MYDFNYHYRDLPSYRSAASTHVSYNLYTVAKNGGLAKNFEKQIIKFKRTRVCYHYSKIL